jgi:CRISPR-associated protein Cas1
MEELRPYLVERLTLSFINDHQVEAKGFIAKESGGIIMTDEMRKVNITSW